MNILAVDTCLEPGSIALLSEDFASSRDGSPEGEPEVVALPPGWRSVALHKEIRKLLARHGLTTADLDLYAVTAGPGPFTGVRLGLTAVKGLAEVHDKTLVPISTLEALAFSALSSTAPDATASRAGRSSFVAPPCLLAPVLDARRGQVFAAAYKVAQTEAAVFEPILPESVCSLRSFLDQIRASGIGIGPHYLHFCITDEALLLPAIEEFGWTADAVIRVAPQLAGTVARMAAERFRQGKGTGALTADANYVRASDAELFWKD